MVRGATVRRTAAQYWALGPWKGSIDIFISLAIATLNAWKLLQCRI